MITRRRLLVGGLALAGLATAGFFTGRVAAQAEIVAILHRRLAFLKLDDADLHAFAKDQIDTLLAKRPTWNRWKYHFHELVSPSSGTQFAPQVALQAGQPAPARSRREQIEDSLVSTFLMSSDFFSQGADESKPVRYQGFYDPMRACGNPFARLCTGSVAA
ncbi:MAG TPA: hypothetical protein VMU33_07205 [Burkholderiaceae bacterium]|nr:hypothetical protein [Burkholderiaceae bacterium]